MIFPEVAAQDSHRRISLAQLLQLVQALGLPVATPSADLQVMVQEKLRELERDPENVQLVINEFSDGLKSLQDGHCSKSYPKQYMPETQLSADSYPLYRRRSPDNGGQVSTISMRIGGSRIDQEIDNRWIVP